MQRRLMNLTVRDYRGAGDGFRAALAEQEAAIEARWCSADLRERAFVPHRHRPVRSRRDVEDLLHHSGVRELGASDAAVLIVTGHGRISPAQRHYLELPRTAPDRLAATGYPTAELVMSALASHAEHVLVIVNCCHAGQLDGELSALVKELPADRQRLGSLAVFSTGRFDERPRVTEFTELLRRVDHQLRSTAGIARAHLSVEEFRAELVRAARAEPALPEPLLLWPRAFSDVPHLCLPNPGFAPVTTRVAPALAQAATPDAELDFWLDKASGRTSATDAGWYFAGRRELTGRLARFLRDGSGLMIVTGAAGTGKSAIIAHAVTLSDPGSRSDPRVRRAVRAAPADTIPPVSSIDAAVLVRQKDATRFATDLLVALGERPQVPDPGEALPDLRRRQLAATITGRGRAVTLVVDGLDEASDPATVLGEQLGPLLRLTGDRGRPLVRMIVGLRSTGGDDRDPHGLLATLERAAAPADVQRLRTDGPATRDDIADYLERLLASGPYADDAAARNAAAALVADAVAPSFLDARLVGRRLRSAATVQDLDDAGWRRSLADGTVGQLRVDLAAAAADDAGEILAVLRAAAFARGTGVPWAQVWPTLAEAVLDRPLRDPHTTISRVLGGPLSGYLTRDVDDDRVVHRPAHDLLARVLRAEVGADRPADPAAVHERIAVRLADLVAADPTQPPHPYVRRHLVEHAHLGGALDDRHVPPGFLAWDTGGRIRELLGLPVVPAPERRTLATWAKIEPQLAGAEPAGRWAGLAVAHAAEHHRNLPVTDCPAGAVRTPVHWARWDVPDNVVGHVPDGVIELVCVPWPDGRTVLAVGTNGDGVVRLWDPLRGVAVGTVPTGDHRGVGKLAVVPMPDGRVVLATVSGEERVLRLWDAVRGTPVGEPLAGHTGWIYDMTAVPLPDGRTLLASCDADGVVMLWDPLRATAVGRLPTGHTGPVWVVAPVPLPDGRTLLAIHGRGGPVRLWDPLRGVPAGELPGVDRGAGNLVAVPVPGGRTLLAGVGARSTVLVWDALDGTPVGGPLTGHTSEVRALAPVPLPGGRVLLATVGWGGVRVWDPLLGTAVGAPLTGHTDDVYAVAAVPLPAGGSLLASGSQDGTVRLWDPVRGPRVGSPPSGARTGHPRAEHVRRTWAAATVPLPDGRTLLATASTDGTTHLWDPQRGDPIGDPLPSHVPGVVALAVVPLPDGRIVLAVGDQEGTVRLWDPLRGTPFGVPLPAPSRPMRSIAAVPLPDGRTLLATARDGAMVWLWDPVRGERVGELFTSLSSGADAVAAVPLADGRTLLATGSGDGLVRLWDPASGAVIGDPLRGHTGWLSAVASVPLPDGRTLLATAAVDGTVRLWDPVRGVPVRQPLISRNGSVHAIAGVPTPDGRALLATATGDQTVRIWDVELGTEIGRVAVTGSVTCLATGQDDEDRPWVAFGGDGGVAVVGLA